MSKSVTEFKQTAVLGAGVIGASWTALFLASGREVAVHDISAATERNVRDYIGRVWPTLEELGLVKDGNPERVRFCKSAVEAVEGASFVQENVPERIEIKHALFTTIEPALGPDAVVATSASGLTLSEMQAGWKVPAGSCSVIPSTRRISSLWSR
nr:3-hydroxyacyl-CoA dehydrogenase NAD-binding domain-containing protein [Mesorhizobium sp. SP-1A]